MPRAATIPITTVLRRRDTVAASLAEARRLVTLLWRKHGEAVCYEDDSPEQNACYDALDHSFEALDALVGRLEAKPVLSLPDFAALALIAFFRQGGDPTDIHGQLAEAAPECGNASDHAHYLQLLCLSRLLTAAEGGVHHLSARAA